MFRLRPRQASGRGPRSLADPGRANEQHVGGVVQEPQRGQIFDELLIHTELRSEVEVLDLSGVVALLGRVWAAWDAAAAVGIVLSWLTCLGSIQHPSHELVVP